MTGPSFSPLAGPPHTVESTNSAGAPVITVNLSSVGPRVAKWAQRAAVVIGAIGFVWPMAACIASGTLTGQDIFVVVGAAPMGWAASRTILRSLFKSRTQVVFENESVTVKRDLRTAKTFNRNVTHSFTRVPHDKTESEARRIRWLEETFGRKWLNLPYTDYFGRSEHISLIYLNQRHTIITASTRRKAEQIHTRLLAASDVMDGHANRGVGQVMSASNDWASPLRKPVEKF
ncbi:hypothetical protein [Pyruvatibacter mobilis]|uniref:hypothetical protein n=1 Tax=Pyruvatibacter mobilis TaxID=1712261 RepID=UPI003C7E1969